MIDEPTILLGRVPPSGWLRRLFPRVVRVRASELRVHGHLIGVSGSGKSRYLCWIWEQLTRAGYAATLLDPHGDLAELILDRIVEQNNEAILERLLYLDLPGAEREGRYLPFNVLAQPGSPYTIASNVREALHRAYPQLAGGAAPMFDTIVQDGVKSLAEQGYPLTALFRFITEAPFRERLLRRESDPDIIAFWHDQFDRLKPQEQAIQAGAALRRAHLLTFNPVLKHSLGQEGLIVNFRALMDQNVSVLINLALPDGEARHLLACLLTVFAEQAALARAETGARPEHFLFIDEFFDVSAQSSEALSRMLSQTRKFGLFSVMSHQTWSQTNERLLGAVQNVGLDVAFRLGRSDAERTALSLARVDPRLVSVRQDGETVGVGIREQYEREIQRLQDLPDRHAVVRLPNGAIEELVTPAVSDPVVDGARLAAIKRHYLTVAFRPAASRKPASRREPVKRRAPAEPGKRDGV